MQKVSSREVFPFCTFQLGKTTDTKEQLYTAQKPGQQATEGTETTWKINPASLWQESSPCYCSRKKNSKIMPRVKEHNTRQRDV